MNKNQKTLAYLYLLALTFIVFYIPYYVYQAETNILIMSGYDFIFSMSSRYIPNVSMLFFEFLVASTMASVGYFILQD